MKFEDVKKQFAKQISEARCHLGPRKVHHHGFGCDCGLYTGLAGKLREGKFTYRENIEGIEVGIVPENKDPSTEDQKLIKEGYILHDE